MSFAQIGIGTSNPEGALDVVSSDSGLVLPRVANTAAVTTPVSGMLIYDISSTCIKAYENDTWSDCISASVTNDCDTNGFSGAYVNGASNTFSVTLENPTFLTTTISFATTDVALSGTAASGITVSDVSPASATLNSGDTQLVTYTLSGTPANLGTLIADWSKLNLSCQRTTNVTNGDAIFTLPQTERIVSLLHADPPVIDIQGVMDNGDNQVVVNVPYTSGVGSYDAYISAAVAVTGEGGDSNNVTISYPAGSFSATGTIPVTVTVDGDGTFNVPKQAFNAVTTLATLDFQVNGNSEGNLLLEVAGGVPDRAFGDGLHNFVYLPVVAKDGNTWLNHNLGAHYADINHASFDPRQQATALDDHLAYGSAYQWGRLADGHELVTWTGASTGTAVNGLTSTNATTDTPGHASFITETISPNDWRDPQNIDLWQGEAGTNNPCPVGYRLPTDVEQTQLLTDAGINNSTTAANSNLAFTTAGFRVYSSGAFSLQGSTGSGYYWSSTVNGANSQALGIGISSNVVAIPRAYAMSVRCIKD